MIYKDFMTNYKNTELFYILYLHVCKWIIFMVNLKEIVLTCIPIKEANHDLSWEKTVARKVSHIKVLHYRLIINKRPHT